MTSSGARLLVCSWSCLVPVGCVEGVRCIKCGGALTCSCLVMGDGCQYTQGHIQRVIGGWKGLRLDIGATKTH